MPCITYYRDNTADPGAKRALSYSAITKSLSATSIKRWETSYQPTHARGGPFLSQSVTRPPEPGSSRPHRYPINKLNFRGVKKELRSPYNRRKDLNVEVKDVIRVNNTTLGAVAWPGRFMGLEYLASHYRVNSSRSSWKFSAHTLRFLFSCPKSSLIVALNFSALT